MTVRDTTTTRRTLVLIIVLLLLALAGVAFAYWRLVMPASLTDAGSNEEGYRHRSSLYGFGAERLSRPSDVVVGEDGRIYVADTFNHRVVVYDRSGTYLEHFGDRGTGRFQLEYPSGIAVAEDGTVFVLAKGLNKVVIYDPAHEPRWEIDVESPQVATVVGDRLYLATNRGIMVGNLDGTLITAFGRRGRDPGQVDHPGGIAVGEDGTIYISDSLNYRVQALDGEGNAKWVAGERPATDSALQDRSRRFGLPAGLALGEDGMLYLVDAFTGTVQVLDSEDGTELRRVAEWGHEEGLLYYPAGIAHGQGSTFAIADKFNDRVQIFDIFSPTEPAALSVLRGPLPWILLIALLPLLLLLVRRRHVADRAFLDRIVTRGGVAQLVASVSRLRVTQEIAEEFANVVQDDVRLDKILRAARASTRKANRFAERYGLDEESSAVLAMARRPLRLPSVLLADNELLGAAATKERLVLIDSTEVLEHWGMPVEADDAPEEGVALS